MFHPCKLAGTIALAISGIAVAHAGDVPFGNVVAFGDSLTDDGNIHSIMPGSQERFTTNPGFVAIEDVARHYGFTLTPSTSGGTDYAWGGARAATDLGPILSTQTQIANYLAGNGGHADPKALYSLWTGANDLLNIDPANAQAQMTAAANAAVAQVNTLQAAGARYIVVFNLPDVGKTPGVIGTPLAGAAGMLGNLFNGTLDAGMARARVGVIPVNVYAVLNEVIADPGRYGFSDVTHMACTSDSSLYCTPSTLTTPDAASTYLFADDVHPTSAAHAMLAEVAISELTAPGQISLLGEAPLAATAAQYRAIRNQMLADDQGADTRTFASIDYGRQHFDAAGTAPKTSSDDINLTLGVDARASEHVSFGVALGLGQHNADVDHGGGYKMQDISGLGYAFYHRGGGYLGGFLGFGQSNFKDIDRRIQIGADARTESGKTDGSHLGGGLEGGWWFHLADRLQTGPFAHVEWQTVKVNGYDESGADSTAMWFGRQQRDALISTLGWRLQGQWQVGELMMSPYAQVSWNHDGKADARDIKAGLNSLSGSFEMPGYRPDKSWGDADLGLSAQLTPSVTSWVAVSSRFSDDSQRDNTVNMGLKISF